MTPDEIYAELRRRAPSIAFDISCSPDEDEVWDGDAPDPADEGMIAVVVKVTATAIIGGESVEGDAYLGSHYIDPGEENALGDISGYLPQKLEEAVNHLADQVKPEPLSHLNAEIIGVRNFIKEEMRRRYDEQQA